MPRITANGIELEYDRAGEPGEPLLLIGGLGTQLTTWHEDFRDLLIARGFEVIRFDNRDSGLSTSFDDHGTPDLMEVIRGEEPPAYTLEDMADDGAALLDGLGIASAHLVGGSMGGFIAQLVAIRHPEKVRSLVSIMSGPGGADQAPADTEVLALLATPPPPDREGQIERSIEIGRAICGPLFDPEERRREAIGAIERAVNVAGTQRQFGAIAAAGSRIEGLHGVRVPALVIHGDVDPLVPPENGRRTAAAIPGARLLTFPEMGHDMPRPLWPRIVDAIAETADLGRGGERGVS
jgi:pimeloyl-ACP methyl ester carboxylesterase